MIGDKVNRKFNGKEISKKLGINYPNRTGITNPSPARSSACRIDN
jgi:hypothetical protein